MHISDWSSDVCSSDLSDDRRGNSLRGFPPVALRRPWLANASRPGCPRSQSWNEVARRSTDLSRSDSMKTTREQIADFQLAFQRPLNNILQESLSIEDRVLLAKLLLEETVEYCTKGLGRSEEHTSELQSLMRISYAVFCLKKKKKQYKSSHITYTNNQKHEKS